MANNSELLNQLLSKEALTGISKATGVSSKEVSGILASALPSLLSGAASQTASTTSGFAQALMSHASADTSSLSSFFSKVDLSDGTKIVSHLLGKNDQTIKTAASAAGVSTESANKVVSAAAPLLLSLLGKQTQAASSAKTTDILSAASSLLGKTDKNSISSMLFGKNSGVDLSDGIDAKDVAGILGKFVK